tara:strand:+ start:531 stop:1676 length:1146 start_codon:yes stop_codon:yes gene_type:complete
MILFINKRFNNRNGAEKSGSDVVNSLLKANADLALLYIDINNNFNDIINYKNISILKSPLYKLKINTFSFKEIYDFIESKIFDKIRFKKIKSLKINYIIANSLSSEYYAKKLAKSLNVKCCLIVRESPDFYKNPNKTVNRIHYFDQIVFVSSNVMKDWISILPDLKTKSKYIPNTINESSIDKIINKRKSYFQRKLNFNNNDINIVIVGKFLTRKNQSIVINNLEQFHKINKKIKFHFIGKNFNSYGYQMKKILRKTKYNEMVRLHGFKKNVLEYIYASDYLILTALAEASPRVLYEAMLLKTLIISSEVGGASELIKHEKTGYLYEKNNVKDLLFNLKKALNSDNYNSMVKESNEFYHNTYSNEIHQNNYKNLYKLLKTI